MKIKHFKTTNSTEIAKSHYKIRFNRILNCLLFIFIVLITLNTSQAINIEEDYLIYSNWVVPGRNITLLDELIEFYGFEDMDNLLIVEQGSERLSINKGREQSTKDFLFRVLDSRFDIRLLEHRTRDGMPMFGEMPRGSGSKFYSFLIEIELLRPILEFQRTVNNIQNNKDLTIIESKINDKINVSLQILNHGKKNTDFVHYETFPENAIITINSIYGATSRINYELNRIEIKGNTEDKPKINYSILMKEDFEFEFDSKNHITYEDTNYTFSERNRTKIIVDSKIEIVLGFHNGAIFRNRDTESFVGDKNVIGGLIRNNRDQPVKANIIITFPDSEREVHKNERRYFDEIYEKNILIENKTQFELMFDIMMIKKGIHPIEIIFEVDIGENIIKEKTNLKLINNIIKPKPKAIFNSTRNNESIDMTLFLEYPKETFLKEIIVDIILSEKNYKEEFSYRYNNIKMPKQFLLNRISRNVINSSEFNVEIKGKITNEFGDSTSFARNISIGEGFTNIYRNKRLEIMHENNLDERYESRPRESVGYVEVPFMNILGLVVGTDKNSSNPIISAIILFTIILSIQLIIYKNRKS